MNPGDPIGEPIPEEFFSLLPSRAKTLVRQLGAHDALVLMEVWGGLPLYVAKGVDHVNPLVREHLSAEAVAALVQHYPAAVLEVPRLHVARAQLRMRLIAAEGQAGASLSECARRHRLTRRRIAQIRTQYRASQPDLFGYPEAAEASPPDLFGAPSKPHR